MTCKIYNYYIAFLHWYIRGPQLFLYFTLKVQRNCIPNHVAKSKLTSIRELTFMMSGNQRAGDSDVSSLYHYYLLQPIASRMWRDRERERLSC